MNTGWESEYHQPSVSGLQLPILEDKNDVMVGIMSHCQVASIQIPVLTMTSHVTMGSYLHVLSSVAFSLKQGHS